MSNATIVTGCIGNNIRSICRDVFCRKGVLKKFAKLTGKHLRQSLSATLLKERLCHRCFVVILRNF